jgi:hypothetical protein
MRGTDAWKRLLLQDNPAAGELVANDSGAPSDGLRTTIDRRLSAWQGDLLSRAGVALSRSKIRHALRVMDVADPIGSYREALTIGGGRQGLGKWEPGSVFPKRGALDTLSRLDDDVQGGTRFHHGHRRLAAES